MPVENTGIGVWWLGWWELGNRLWIDSKNTNAGEKWNPDGGKKGTGAWDTTEKYFLLDESQQQKLIDKLVKKVIKANETN